jgi:hypothetical protein
MLQEEDDQLDALLADDSHTQIAKSSNTKELDLLKEQIAIVSETRTAQSVIAEEEQRLAALLEREAQREVQLTAREQEFLNKHR